jgi:predicted nucleotide-binding protein
LSLTWQTYGKVPRKKSSRSKKKPRPSAFVGSSAESLDIAYAVQDNLQHDLQVTVWSQGVFDLSKTTLESLARKLSACDFGLFVFAPDDAIRLRKKTYSAVRDNVVLELGLFIGKLGVDRTFIIVPDNVSDMRIPTDLLGVTLGKYDGERDDGDLQAALGPVCNQIRKSVKKLKFLNRAKRRPARGAAVSSRVTIESALYGSGRRRVDVKGAISKELRRGKRNIFVGNQLGGDPTPGREKDLRVKFSYRGEKYEAVIPEGRDLTFPE